MGRVSATRQGVTGSVVPPVPCLVSALYPSRCCMRTNKFQGKASTPRLGATWHKQEHLEVSIGDTGAVRAGR